MEEAHLGLDEYVCFLSHAEFERGEGHGSLTETAVNLSDGCHFLLLNQRPQIFELLQLFELDSILVGNG